MRMHPWLAGGRIVAGMQGDAGPGQPLHERHGRVAVEVGAVPFLLLQNRVHAFGRAVSLPARGHGRLADYPVTGIDRQRLPPQADDDVNRIAPRPFVQPISAGRGRRCGNHNVAGMRGGRLADGGAVWAIPGRAETSASNANAAADRNPFVTMEFC
jgi:hypothetical protein